MAMTAGIGGRAVLALAVLGMLAAGCSRNAAPMTQCTDGQPDLPRVTDVAPPNCDMALPAAAG